MKSRSKINNFKSVMMKGAYLLGMRPKKIANKFNVLNEDSSCCKAKINQYR